LGRVISGSVAVEEVVRERVDFMVVLVGVGEERTVRGRREREREKERRGIDEKNILNESEEQKCSENECRY
jgi:hypothetical protein